jgi:hypothetical protein
MTPEQQDERSFHDQAIERLRLVEHALHCGDVKAARLAWYDLGRLLSHDAYLVLRPWDMPLSGGPAGTLEALTAWLARRHQEGLRGQGDCVTDAVQAVARALLRRELDMEPEGPKELP